MRRMQMMKTKVSELTFNSRALFEHQAILFNLKQDQIDEYLTGNIQEIADFNIEFGFRICENPECREIFNEGFLTEDSDTFCSTACAEKIIYNIEEDDYGTYIFYTEWEPGS